MRVLGDGATRWLWLVALIGAWCLLRERSWRCWILAYSLAFTVAFMSPFLAGFWGSHVTAPYLLWRLFWLVPLPLLLALLLTEGLAAGLRGGRSVALATVLIAALPLALDRPWKDRWTQLGTGLKVLRFIEYDLARRLAKIAGPGRLVIAPERASTWIPTLRRHLYPVVARQHYTEALRVVFAHRVDVAELEERLILHRYVGGKSQDPRAPEVLERWLRDKGVAAVATYRVLPWLPELREVLERNGFTAERYQKFWVFSRAPTESAAPPAARPAGDRG